MPRKNIFKLIVIIAVSIVIAVVLMTLVSHQKGGYSLFRGSYSTQELILDEMRIIVTPLEVSKDHPSRFRVNLESFEAPALIDMNLAETALIEFKDGLDPLLPTTWELEHVSEFTHEGTLTFPPMTESSSSFTLVIFSLSEYRFPY